MVQELTLSKVAQKLGAIAVSAPSGEPLSQQAQSAIRINGLASLDIADHDQLSFLANKKYRSQLADTKAAAVLLSQDDLPNFSGVALIVSDPYGAYALCSRWFSSRPELPAGVHPSAVVHEDVHIPCSVAIGPCVVIGRGVSLGDHVEIGAGTVIGDYCQIGSATRLAARVTLYHKVHIGSHCLIHSGAVIGADGFGFAPGPDGWQKIAQIGGVTVGDHVEIGANTCIDRGALKDTVIESGVIIDNLVQIAHNCRIGSNTAIAGCVGIAGSTQVGPECTLAGQAGVAGHLTLVKGTHVGMQAQVTRSISEPGQYASGTGLWPQKAWLKLVARLRRQQSRTNKVNTN